MSHAREVRTPARMDSDFVAASAEPVHGMDFAAEIIDLIAYELTRHVYAQRIQDAAGLYAAATLSAARLGALMDVLRGVERMFSTRERAGADALEFVRLYGPHPPPV